MTKVVLWCFDLFAGLFRLLGVDYPQFRAILEVKLLMDGRRQRAGFHARRRNKPINTFVWSLAFYAFFGLFASTIVFAAESPLVGMTLLNSFIMLMVGLSLIADYTSVLLDTTDNAVLHPRPVTERTLLCARAAHIIAYLGLLTLALSAGTFITGTIHYHLWFPLVFAGALLCTLVLVVFGVQMFYLVLMRLTHPERFRDIILYFQIGMTIVMVGGYQLLPRLMDMDRLKTLTIDHAWWVYVYPPAWMAAPIDLLCGHVGPAQITLTLLAVATPLAAMVLGVRVLAPGFHRALARMETARLPGNIAEAGQCPKTSPAERLARWVTRNAQERAAFAFTWTLSARDRQFKLRTYPSVALVFLFSIVMLMGSGGRMPTLTDLRAGYKYLFPLYYASMLVPLSIMQLRYSDQYAASWLYYALPVSRPGAILAGALKMLLVRFVVPAYLLVAGGTLAVWGWRILPDVVLAVASTLLICGAYALWFGARFPFSEAFNIKEGSGRAGIILFMLVVPAALGCLHYLLLKTVPGGVLLLIPIVLLLGVLTMRAYARTTWTKVLAGSG